MKFSKIVGYRITPEIEKVVKDTEHKLSDAFAELSMAYDNKSFGSKLGGDVFFLQIIAPHKHICDLSSYQLQELEEKEKELVAKAKDFIEKGIDDENLLDEMLAVKAATERCERTGIFTAATNGSTFFWAPVFLNKLSKIGLRLLICHEGIHTYFSHSARKGTRNSKLFNISLDFKVNNFLMQDLIARGIRDPIKTFTDNLGEFINFEEYSAILRNPFLMPERLDYLSPIHQMRKALDASYIDPGEGKQGLYYAEKNLPKDMIVPEKVYDHLFAQIPKCDVCGRVGVYEKPQEYKDIEVKINGEYKACEHEECCKKCGCTVCQKSGKDYIYLNPFDTEDDAFDKHLDMDVSESELQKRIKIASDLARQFGQNTNGFDNLLRDLERPSMTWQDFARIVKSNKKQGNKKRNWGAPKKKALCAGLYVPTTYANNFTILCGYDCSASMNAKTVSKGIAQLQVLKDLGTTIYLVPWSHITYWDEMVKIEGADSRQLLKAKIKIDGGTECSTLFNEYQKQIGDVDLIVCITDTYLANTELSNVKTPPNDTRTIWLQMERNNFKPKFGKVFHLFNE